MKPSDTLKYMSHLPLLAACIRETRGPTLELGMGLGSTPFLHAMSIGGKFVNSLDTDKEWVKLFKQYDNANHKIELVTNWSKVEAYSLDWGVVLVDQIPDRARGHSIEMLKDRAYIILLHDSNCASNCRAAKIIKEFRYTFTLKKYYPWTTAMSNYDNMKFLEGVEF